jgi:hypothetical protein
VESVYEVSEESEGFGRVAICSFDRGHFAFGASPRR